MRGDEAPIVDAFAAWLEAEGWAVDREVEFCDVVARRGAERLFAEAKGRTTSPGLDVDTLYGQLLRRVPLDAQGARFGVVVPTEARAAALRVRDSVRRMLDVTVYVVDQDGRVEPIGAASAGEHAPDAFGLPANFFGPHPEAVWGVIGRTLSVSALLEDRLVTLLQTLMSEPQTAFADLPPSTVVRKLRAAAPGGDADWVEFGPWLTAVADALEWRNAVAHSLWPAQSDNRLFGHRLDRKSGERRCVDKTTDELPRRLSELIALTEQWQRWFALANHPLRLA